MPKTNLQKFFYSFLTVAITVCAFVFYSLYVVEGVNLADIRELGGTYMFGRIMPLWSVFAVEFVFALTLATLVGSRFAPKMAVKIFPDERPGSRLFETAYIASTAFIMCLSMSFIAALIYYPYANGFNVLTLFANWIRLVCHNFPFALLSQVFFIQPFVRKVFGLVFGAKKIKAAV